LLSPHTQVKTLVQNPSEAAEKLQIAELIATQASQNFSSSKSLQEDVTAAGRKEATTGAGGGGLQKKTPKAKTGKSWGSLVHRSGSQLDETSQVEHVTRLSKRLTLRCDQQQLQSSSKGDGSWSSSQQKGERKLRQKQQPDETWPNVDVPNAVQQAKTGEGQPSPVVDSRVGPLLEIAPNTLLVSIRVSNT